MRAVDRGESFIVTRNGKEVGQLTPFRARRFVSAEAALEAFAGAPTVDVQRFRADVDAAVDQSTEPRA